ncbi:MAG: glycerol-3-phosphate 1-O-acyltransferase PlsY [Alphaproteobacteria bacterium]|nr:glycerol-3-phosphate 1-O-acyltransferase PlsY [Alphaproteobacteria bacterium]
MEYIIIGIIAGYLIGSIPFGFILLKLAGLGDVRKIGSGTVGATNVMRLGGFKFALATFILDFLKAFIPAYFLGPWAGIAAVVGHNYSIYLGMKSSGKGFSASGGVLTAIAPIMLLPCFAIWLVIALATGYSSLAAIVLLIITPPFGFLISNQVGAALVTLGVIGLFVYRNNIKRLLNGTEPKIQWRKPK